MARKQKPERLRQIYSTVEENPGIRPSLVAHRLKLPRSMVTRSLPALEDEGYLLSEDNKGRLWPFSRKK